MIRTSAINLVLKVGLAITSIAFAIASFWKANEVLLYYPHFVISIFGEMFTLALGAAAAIVMGIWLLSQKHKFAAAFTYTLLILFAILFNLDSIRFLSTGWPLLCMAAALSIRYYPRIRVIVSHKFGNKIIERMKIVPAFPEEDDTEDETPKLEQKEVETIEENLYGKEEPFEEDKIDNDVANKYAPLSSLKTVDIRENESQHEDESINDDVEKSFEQPFTPGENQQISFEGRKKVARIKISKKYHRKHGQNRPQNML